MDQSGKDRSNRSVSRATDDNEDDKARSIGLSSGGNASDLKIEASVDANEQGDANHSIGIELLQQFIVCVPRLELVGSEGGITFQTESNPWPNQGVPAIDRG